MPGILSKAAKNTSEWIYKFFGKDSGNMLLATSILGFTLSAGAQIGAIVMNKRYSFSQKVFMVPQEIGELVMAATAIFVITKPMQKITAKMVKTGKIAPKELVKYMEDNNIISKRGKADFNLGNEIKNIIKKVQSSDEFINSNNKESLLSVHQKTLGQYEACADSVSAITTTAAGLVTTGLVVPVVRNNFAAYWQKQGLNYYNSITTSKPHNSKI